MSTHSIVPDDIQDVHNQFSITSSWETFPQSECILSLRAPTWKQGNDILRFWYPGSRVTLRGPRSHSWSPVKLCKYELMSSLIASRINSIDIILEFQIPAPSRVLPHRIDITRFRPDSSLPDKHDVQEIQISRRMMDNVHNNTVIQKLDRNSNLETGFSCSPLKPPSGPSE